MNIFGNTIWRLVADSDAMCAGVLLVLLFLSIFCWTIVIYKFVLLRKKKKELQRALLVLKPVKTLDDLLAACAQLHASFSGSLLSSGMSALKSLLESKKHGVSVFLSEHEYQLLKQSIDETVHQLVSAEESYFSMVNASAAISPLLGLFGTVWGLIDAFISIGQKQNADIATVAPGVAEALITTAAGLMVAIPALTMVYYLNLQVRHVELQLFRVADRFTWIIYQLFGYDHRQIHKKQNSEESVDALNIPTPHEEQKWRE